VSQIFNHLLRRQIGSRWPTVEYLSTREEVIFATLKGYVMGPAVILFIISTKTLVILEGTKMQK
jgi:hypothetical protein